jgi:hypothetical protein
MRITLDANEMHMLSLVSDNTYRGTIRKTSLLWLKYNDQFRDAMMEQFAQMLVPVRWPRGINCLRWPEWEVLFIDQDKTRKLP